MTEAAAVPRLDPPRFGVRAAGLWAGAAALVLVAHVAVAYAVQNFSLTEMSDGGPPPALAIEMSPMVVAPAVQEETPMSDVVTPDQAEPVEETIAEVKPVTEPTPEPVVEDAEPVAEQPVEAEEATVPEPVAAEVDSAERAAATTRRGRARHRRDGRARRGRPTAAAETGPDGSQGEQAGRSEEDDGKEACRKAEPAQEEREEGEGRAGTVTTASIDAKAAAKAAAPKSSDGASRSSVSPSRWNASLAAWIRRHTRYPSAAKSRRAEGTPNVTFIVDASGRVVSARLARSSGDADLDRAALSALQGATVPTPPAELGARVTRTAPFVFSLRD